MHSSNGFNSKNGVERGRIHLNICHGHFICLFQMLTNLVLGRDSSVADTLQILGGGGVEAFVISEKTMYISIVR